MKFHIFHVIYYSVNPMRLNGEFNLLGNTNKKKCQRNVIEGVNWIIYLLSLEHSIVILVVNIEMGRVCSQNGGR